MYGTVAHLKLKPGSEAAVRALMQEWNRERKPKVRGVVGGYLFELDSDPQRAILVAVFQDRDTYFANAEDPEQDRWFRRFREHLAEDPVWHDGEVSVSE